MILKGIFEKLSFHSKFLFCYFLIDAWFYLFFNLLNINSSYMSVEV